MLSIINVKWVYGKVPHPERMSQDQFIRVTEKVSDMWSQIWQRCQTSSGKQFLILGRRRTTVETLMCNKCLFFIGTQMSRTQCSQLSQSKNKSNLGDICFFLLHLICVKLDFYCLPWSVNKFNNVRKSDLHLHFKVQAWQAKNSTLPPFFNKNINY